MTAVLCSTYCSEGDGEGHTVESRCEGEADELANVVLRKSAEETRLVHGGETRDEQDPETTSGSRSGLGRDILTGTEVANTDPCREGLGEDTRERLEDEETTDTTEELRAESEASLETKVQVGGLDDGTEQATTVG